MGPPSVDVQAAKSELRAAMRRVRRVIASDPDDRGRRSGVIAGRLIQAFTAHVGGDPRGRRVLVYEPLAGEPDLDAVLGWAADTGVAVFVPLVRGPELLVGRDGVDPGTLDVVVVPGLAFTIGGHRLGQGGGHFDRFLPGVSATCLKVGVAFAEQLVDRVPVEPHDAVLDLVITDA